MRVKYFIYLSFVIMAFCNVAMATNLVNTDTFTRNGNFQTNNFNLLGGEIEFHIEFIKGSDYQKEITFELYDLSHKKIQTLFLIKDNKQQGRFTYTAKTNLRGSYYLRVKADEITWKVSVMQKAEKKELNENQVIIKKHKNELMKIATFSGGYESVVYEVVLSSEMSQLVFNSNMNEVFELKVVDEDDRIIIDFKEKLIMNKKFLVPKPGTYRIFISAKCSWVLNVMTR